jgi:hypothetical protein
MRTSPHLPSVSMTRREIEPPANATIGPAELQYIWYKNTVKFGRDRSSALAISCVHHLMFIFSKKLSNHAGELP